MKGLSGKNGRLEGDGGPLSYSIEANRGLLADVGRYGVGNLLARFMGAISTAVLARLLTVEQFGQLDFLQGLATLGVVSLSLQTEMALQRLYHLADDRERGRLLATHLMMLTLVGLLMAPAVLIGARPLLGLLTPNQASAMEPEWLAPFFLSGFWFNHVLTLLRTSRRSQSAVLFASGVTAVQVLLAIPLALQFGVGGVLLARALAEGGGSLVVLWRSRREYWFVFSWPWLRRSIRFGLPLLPEVAGRGIMENVTRYFLIVSIGARGLGYLAAGFRVSLVLAVFVGAIKTAWMPFAFSEANGGVDSGEQMPLGTYLSLYLKLTTVMCLMLILFSADIIYVLVSPRYMAAAPAVGLLGASAVVQGAIMFLKTPFLSRERTVPVMAASVLGTLAGIGFAAVTVPRFGLLPAAGTPMVANFVTVITLYLLLPDLRGLSWLPAALGVVCAGVSVICVTVVPWLVSIGFWFRLMLGVVLVLVSLVILRPEIKRMLLSGPSGALPAGANPGREEARDDTP